MADETLSEAIEEAFTAERGDDEVNMMDGLYEVAKRLTAGLDQVAGAIHDLASAIRESSTR